MIYEWAGGRRGGGGGGGGEGMGGERVEVEGMFLLFAQTTAYKSRLTFTSFLFFFFNLSATPCFLKVFLFYTVAKTNRSVSSLYTSS